MCEIREWEKRNLMQFTVDDYFREAKVAKYRVDAILTMKALAHKERARKPMKEKMSYEMRLWNKVSNIYEITDPDEIYIREYSNDENYIISLKSKEWKAKNNRKIAEILKRKHCDLAEKWWQQCIYCNK